MKRRIDGYELDKMLRNALAYLYTQVDYINDLNVFPVADGDTGTNMYRTLENGLKATTATHESGEYLKELAKGMLFGARGNSGVILSQFFNGMYQELARKEWIGPGELRNGLLVGYRTAYKAVVQPVEGTVLTVAREGIENIRTQIKHSTPIEAILSMYIAEMKKTLTFTPEMLSVLKESGVVDSGAVGFIAIFEGMLKYLYGETFEQGGTIEITPKRQAEEKALFNENSEFSDGYCLEFILQLMRNNGFNQRFSLDKFIADLKLYGSSIVAVRDNTCVKVHIHTLHPARVLSLCEEFGVFVDFKLENMQLQHNEKKEKAKKQFAIIAAVNGEGFKSLYSSLGCDEIISAPSNYNTSAEEFCECIKRANAVKTVILPNNSNSLLAAKQAKELLSELDVEIIPTKNAVEGYFALAMDVPDSNSGDFRVAQLKSGSDGLTVLSVTTATKEFSGEGVTCKVGDFISLAGGEVLSSADNAVSAVLSGFDKLQDICYKETCVIFAGLDADKETTDALMNAISDKYSITEFEILNSGQELYHYMIGLV